MAWGDDDHPFFQDGVKLMARCPLCQTRYQPSLARVLAEREDAYLLHMPCVKCHSAVVALIFTNMFGMNSVGVLTDLTGDEVMPARDRVVTADDVLNLYQATRERPLADLLT